MTLPKVDTHLNEKLKDPYFRELYELDQQKLAIVKRVVAYRIQKNLSQGQLAKKVGVTQQHISKIENGEFSSIATLEKVLLHLGYTVRMKAVPLDKETAKKIENKTQAA